MGFEQLLDAHLQAKHLGSPNQFHDLELHLVLKQQVATISHRLVQHYQLEQQR